VYDSELEGSRASETFNDKTVMYSYMRIYVYKTLSRRDSGNRKPNKKGLGYFKPLFIITYEK
jgi:hypothetical protein